MCVCFFFLTSAALFVVGLVILCILWLFFGCQYQRNRLPRKTYTRNDLLYVEQDVKLYSLFTKGTTYRCETWMIEKKCSGRGDDSIQMSTLSKKDRVTHQCCKILTVCY